MLNSEAILYPAYHLWWCNRVGFKVAIGLNYVFIRCCEYDQVDSIEIYKSDR